MLTKDDKKLSFDIPIETPKKIVYAMYVRRSEIANPALATSMNVEKAHRILGHHSEETTRKIAKHLGWTMTKGSIKTCLPCTIGKARQKNTIKLSEHECSKVPGERIFTDIASVNPSIHPKELQFANRIGVSKLMNVPS